MGHWKLNHALYAQIISVLEILGIFYLFTFLRGNLAVLEDFKCKQ